jgi:general stress protein YciG
MNTQLKNEAAGALGKRGGKACGENLSPERRSEIARMGGLAG